MDDLDRTIINSLQGGFPVCERPFAEIAGQLNTTEQELISRIGWMLENGTLSRFGPMYHAERMGGSLSLAAMKIPDADFERVVEIVNAMLEVAHNYARSDMLNMWFVLATETPREHAYLCNAEGVQMIRDDIEKEAVTHVMIAACSRRAKTEAFNFPGIVLSRANIREGVLWSQPESAEAEEVTQEMADDYVRMGCAELKKMKLPQGSPNKAQNKRILVVGGGISGLTASLESASAGYEVVLVEKQGELGGWAAQLWKCVPVK